MEHPSRSEYPPVAASTNGRADVDPVFPLVLLETMRDMDRPEEILEGEDVSASMPRHFGLSDVVLHQISRFREAVQRGRPQDPKEVENLIRLVIRRPDAEEIFEAAGRQIARRAWQQRSPSYRRASHWLPATLTLRVARRATRRLFAQLVGPGLLRVTGRPVAVRINGSLTARADPGGAACALYAGVFAETMRQYTGQEYRAEHTECEARGREVCEWRVLAAD